jgi:RND superfamily putative drug exporter
MLPRLADFLHRRRRAVMLALVPILAVAGMIGGPLPGLLGTEDNFDDRSSESVVARNAIADASGVSATPDFVALIRGADAAKVARVRQALEDDPGVAQVFDRKARSADGDSTYLAAAFRSRGSDAENDAIALRLKDDLEAIPGVTAGGSSLAFQQVGTQVSEDLARAEMLAFPLLFLLSLWVFRSMIAALLPLAVGGTSILLTFLVMRGVNEATSLSVFAVNLVTGLGLGLAIDYSLFVVSRFREELERGDGTAPALRRTLATAGRTVIFSSITVAAAAASLIVFPQKFLYSMGIGGLIVALMGALVSLTVLPAMLAMLGPRVNSLSLGRWKAATQRDATGAETGFWYRLSHAVMRRPGRFAIGSATLLVVLGLPFAGVKFTGVDASVLPETQSARVVDDALRSEFPLDPTSPAYVAVRAPQSARAEVEAFAGRLRRLPGAAEVSPPQRTGDLWRIDVVPRDRALEDGAKDLVGDIRAERAPFEVLVGGQTADFVDQQTSLGDHLPIAIALMGSTTLLILFLMTGSVILPLKTLLMNMLTIAAAFGILVFVFQDGRFEGLLDYTSQGALESTQPILLFAIVFGLSTDYGVFLLTRIKEARDAGASEEEAVALGIQRTGRIVTAAALLFMIAIGAFATSEIIFIKQVGIGTALGVLIDATIVRALLVPALMRLLGRWNWWAPRPLARLHARFGLREAAA